MFSTSLLSSMRCVRWFSWDFLLHKTCPQTRPSFVLVVATAVSPRHAPAHPPLFTPCFPTHPPAFPPCLHPTIPWVFSIQFQERTLSTKCSPVTSCRGVFSPCTSYEITTLAPLLPNSISCTPPILHEKRPSKRGPIRGRRCAPCYRRSSAAFRLFRLSGERCGPMNRSKSQRGERVAAENETPVTQAVYPPGIRAAPGGAGGDSVQRRRPGPGPA